MGETIKLEVKLRAFVRKQKKSLWVAVCPSLGIASQGSDRPEAMQSLREAVELWFESCIERGVLDQAIREANFIALPSDQVASDADELITVDRRQEPIGDDIRGDFFSIQIDIPAYQAAMFSGQSASM